MAELRRRIEACPACSTSEFRQLFTKGGRDFWRCTGCDLERQYPLPSPGEIQAYYDVSYTDGRLRSMVDASRMTEVRARYRLREVRPYLAAGRWLDVGCSSGSFVAAARGAGVDAEGIEVARPAVDEARALGRPVTCARIETHEPGYRYDTLTAFDVLEHVPDPSGFMAGARRLLRVGGTLALSVPDQASLSRRLMGKRWYFYIPDGHLFYFKAASLRAFLERNGFVVRRVRKTWKPITYGYALTQLRVLNPVLDAVMRPLARVLPASLADAAIPLPLGEILVVATLTTPGSRWGELRRTGTRPAIGFEAEPAEQSRLGPEIGGDEALTSYPSAAPSSSLQATTGETRGAIVANSRIVR